MLLDATTLGFRTPWKSIAMCIDMNLEKGNPCVVVFTNYFCWSFSMQFSGKNQTFEWKSVRVPTKSAVFHAVMLDFQLRSLTSISKPCNRMLPALLLAGEICLGDMWQWMFPPFAKHFPAIISRGSDNGCLVQFMGDNGRYTLFKVHLMASW